MVNTETFDEQQWLDELQTRPVHEVVLRVSELIGAVGRNQQAKAAGDFGGFAYRGIWDLVNALAGPVHGLLLFSPHILSWQRDGNVTMVHVQYSIIGPMGDVLEPKPDTIGFGSGLTGPGSAMSYARKVMLGELFTIATDAATDTELDAAPRFENYSKPDDAYLTPAPPTRPKLIPVDKVKLIMAEFSIIEDDEVRKIAREEWLETLPLKPHQMPAADFETVRADAARAAKYFNQTPDEEDE